MCNGKNCAHWRSVAGFKLRYLVHSIRTRWMRLYTEMAIMRFVHFISYQRKNAQMCVRSLMTDKLHFRCDPFLALPLCIMYTFCVCVVYFVLFYCILYCVFHSVCRLCLAAMKRTFDVLCACHFTKRTHFNSEFMNHENAL